MSRKWAKFAFHFPFLAVERPPSTLPTSCLTFFNQSTNDRINVNKNRNTYDETDNHRHYYSKKKKKKKVKRKRPKNEEQPLTDASLNDMIFTLFSSRMNCVAPGGNKSRIDFYRFRAWNNKKKKKMHITTPFLAFHEKNLNIFCVLCAKEVEERYRSCRAAGAEEPFCDFANPIYILCRS